MGRRGFCFLVVFFFFGLSGCYYFSAKKEIKSAQGLVEDLKGAGGPTKVPCEYCSAEKFLEISRMEFAENDWKHATGPGRFGVTDRGIKALVSPKQLRRILSKMLNEGEFLSPYGIRSLSKFHERHPRLRRTGGMG